MKFVSYLFIILLLLICEINVLESEIGIKSEDFFKKIMDYDFILIYDYLDNFDNKILKNLFENINSFLVFFYFYGGID